MGAALLKAAKLLKNLLQTKELLKSKNVKVIIVVLLLIFILPFFTIAASISIPGALLKGALDKAADVVGDVFISIKDWGKRVDETELYIKSEASINSYYDDTRERIYEYVEEIKLSNTRHKEYDYIDKKTKKKIHVEYDIIPTVSIEYHRDSINVLHIVSYILVEYHDYNLDTSKYKYDKKEVKKFINDNTAELDLSYSITRDTGSDLYIRVDAILNSNSLNEIGAKYFTGRTTKEGSSMVDMYIASYEGLKY